METLPTLIRRRMRECRFSQREVARRANVTHRAVQLWLEGTEPSLENLKNLATALGVSRDTLLRAADATSFGPAVGGSAFLSRVAGTWCASDDSKQTHPDPLLASADHELEDLARFAIDLRTEDVERVQNVALRWINRLETGKWKKNLDAQGICAKSHLLIARASVERSPKPSMESLDRAERAQRLASAIGDADVYAQAKIDEAMIHRKRGDVTGLASSYDKAFRAASCAIDASPSAWITARAYAERAKVSLSQTRETGFADDMDEARSALKRAPSGNERIWAGVTMEEFSYVHVDDTEARGVATFGTASDLDIKRIRGLMSSAKSHQSGLSLNIAEATLPLALAKTLLRNGGADERQEGLDIVMSALTFSRANGYERQAWATRVIVFRSDIARALPSKTRATCPRCGPRALAYREEDLSYACVRCGSTLFDFAA